MKQLPRQYFDYNCGLLLSLQLQFFALIMVKLKVRSRFPLRIKSGNLLTLRKKSWNLLNFAKNLGKNLYFFVKYK